MMVEDAIVTKNIPEIAKERQHSLVFVYILVNIYITFRYATVSLEEMEKEEK